MMWEDPIVREVREAGKKLEEKANRDLHTFFQNLRKNEKKLDHKVVSKEKKLHLLKLKL